MSYGMNWYKPNGENFASGPEVGGNGLPPGVFCHGFSSGTLVIVVLFPHGAVFE